MGKVDSYLEFWYQAAASPRGIVLAVSDVSIAKQRLYQARSKANDPSLSGISVRTSPVLKDEELWLIKQVPDKVS